MTALTIFGLLILSYKAAIVYHSFGICLKKPLGVAQFFTLKANLPSK